MPKINPYSTLKNKFKPAGSGMVRLYDNIIEPSKLVAMMTVVYGSLGKDLRIHSDLEQMRRDPNAFLYGLLIVFTFLLGFKLLQSVSLARRDYQALLPTIRDYFVFLFLVIFTSGLILRFVAPFGETRWLSIVYLALSIAGLHHFKTLRDDRMSAYSEAFDLVIERRIQGFNVATFVHITLSLACVCVVTWWFPQFIHFADGAIISTFPTICLSALHSSQLTHMAKFLFSNHRDKPEEVIKESRARFRVSSPALEEKDLGIALLGPEYGKFRLITLNRATREQIPEIVDLLIHEFGYIYNYVFVAESDDPCEQEIPPPKVEAVRNVLTRMLAMYGGFGSRGFTRYYAVEDVHDRAVGFILPDGEAKFSVYGLIEWIVLVPVVIWNFDLSSIPRILRHFKRIAGSQPRVTSGEVCLTYLMIKESKRHDHYGTSVVRLLVNALKEEAGDSNVKRIVTLVREHNPWSRALFEKEGFRRVNPRGFTVHGDPFRVCGNIGGPIHLQHDLKANPQ